MVDFISDGQPFENSENLSAEAYGKISPSFSETISSELPEGPVGYLSRAAERGTQAGSSWFDRAVVGISQANAGQEVTQPEESPKLPPDEINKKYAPEGTTITNKPMTEGLAGIIGRQKSEQVERDQVINRYQNAHSWTANMGTGLVSFMLDPLNAASSFVPGIGEDAILGGLSKTAIGTGLVGRTLARAGSQAAAGVVSQAPLTGLKLGLSPEEASDYSLRDAFRDLSFGAAGGALLGAGFGGLHEAGILGPDSVMEEADRLKTTKAPVNHAAISSAVSQIADGRPVEVSPLVAPFDPHEIAAREINPELFGQHDDLQAELASRQSTLRYVRQAESEGIPPERYDQDKLDATGKKQLSDLISEKQKAQEAVNYWHKEGSDSPEVQNSLERLEDANRHLDSFKDQAQVNLQESDFKLRDLIDKTGQAKEQARDLLNSDSDYGKMFQEYIKGRQAQNVRDVAQGQAELYKDGYAPGLSQDTVRQTKEDIYDNLEKNAPPKDTTDTSETSSTTKSPEETSLADLEREWETASGVRSEGLTLTPEEGAELERTSALLDQASKDEQGYNEAVGCIKSSGI